MAAMVSTPKPSTACGDPTPPGGAAAAETVSGARLLSSMMSPTRRSCVGAGTHQQQHRNAQRHGGDDRGVDRRQPGVVVPTPPAQQTRRRRHPDRHHRRADLQRNGRVDRGEPLAEIRRDRGGDVLDDLRAVLGVRDEANPQPVAVVDVLLGQGLGGPQRRAIDQAQRPPAASRGLQRRLTEFPQPTVDHLQQRVGHHRDGGVGVQQDPDLDTLAGHDADHHRPRL